MALVIALVGFGVAPRPLVDSRFAASDDILRLRRVRMLGEQKVIPRAQLNMGLRSRFQP